MKTIPSASAFAAQYIEDVEALNEFGLTKREYFATQALQGLIASDTGYTSQPLKEYQQNVAQVAVSYADALIVALNDSRNLAGLPETETPDDSDELARSPDDIAAMEIIRRAAGLLEKQNKLPY